MKCESGDLARILTPGPFQDRIIRVTHWVDSGAGPEWFYEGEPFVTFMSFGATGYQVTFFDRVLQPIRGLPGADETLAWKPVPLPAIDAPRPQREFAR
jgi:hypothetical protein